MGWFVELSFVESNNGGFSVFKRTEARTRQLAPVQKPLTWRQVAQFVGRRKSLDIYDDSGSVEVRGVEPWQGDVIASVLYRRGFTSFLLGLSDEEIQSLHSRLGDLLSEEADEILTELGEAIEEAGLRRKSVVEIAKFVGASDPWDLEALLSAIRLMNESEQPEQSNTSQQRRFSGRMTKAEEQDFYRRTGEGPVTIFLRRPWQPQPPQQPKEPQQ